MGPSQYEKLVAIQPSALRGAVSISARARPNSEASFQRRGCRDRSKFRSELNAHGEPASVSRHLKIAFALMRSAEADGTFPIRETRRHPALGAERRRLYLRASRHAATLD